MFATAGNSIKLWDAQNYKQHQEIQSLNGCVTDISWSQNGQCIAFLGESVPEITLLAVNAKSTANIGVVRSMDSPSCLQFSNRSSNYFGVGNKDGTVVLWNLKSKSQKKAFTVSDSSISNIAFTHNDSHIAAASRGCLHLLSLMNNSITGPHKIFDKQVITEVVYCHVKKSLLGCRTDGGSLALFDSHACKTLHVFKNVHAAPVSSLAFSPINEILMISVGYDKKLICYNIQSKKQVLDHKSSEPLSSAAFLPGGQHIALGAMTGEVFIHDLRNVRLPLATLAAHNKAVTSILLQPAPKHSKVASNEVSASNFKSIKKPKASSVAASKPPQGTPATIVPIPSVPSSTAHPFGMPAAESSQSDMHSILSPVRSTETFQNQDNIDHGKQKLGNNFVLEDVLSPVRFDDVECRDGILALSSKKDLANLCDDMMSPVRESTQNTDVPPVNLQDGSYTEHKKDEEMLPDLTQKLTSLTNIQTSAKKLLSTNVSVQKENLNPNLVAFASLSIIKDVANVEPIISDRLQAKHALSPVQQRDIPKQKVTSLVRSPNNCVIDFPEMNIDISSPKDNANCANDEIPVKDILPLNKGCVLEKNTSENTNVNKAPDVPEHHLVCGESSGNSASNLQMDLIRNCMTDVLEEFQDEVNMRMMHLQYIITTHNLQLKETLENLQQQQALNADLLLEVEQLRKENAQLRANF
ncbi:hypothetical protein SK128_013734 [Halocaridina rubra]|uniref:Protein NEDD1 n=1 Tax=Halocaridina rubra TaxID=373956 RepID=A0AAN8X9E3_HALRR